MRRETIESERSTAIEADEVVEDLALHRLIVTGYAPHFGLKIRAGELQRRGEPRLRSGGSRGNSLTTSPARWGSGSDGGLARRDWGEGIPRRNSSEQPHVP